MMEPIKQNSKSTDEPNLLLSACFAPLIDPTVARFAYAQRGLQFQTCRLIWLIFVYVQRSAKLYLNKDELNDKLREAELNVG